MLLSCAEGDAAVSLTDSTFSWDSEEEDSERATLRKLVLEMS